MKENVGEHRDTRNAGRQLPCHFDFFHHRRLMQRSQMGRLFNLNDKRTIQQCRMVERVAVVNHPMPDRHQPAVL